MFKKQRYGKLLEKKPPNSYGSLLLIPGLEEPKSNNGNSNFLKNQTFREQLVETVKRVNYAEYVELEKLPRESICENDLLYEMILEKTDRRYTFYLDNEEFLLGIFSVLHSFSYSTIIKVYYSSNYVNLTVLKNSYSSKITLVNNSEGTIASNIYYKAIFENLVFKLFIQNDTIIITGIFVSVKSKVFRVKENTKLVYKNQDFLLEIYFN